MYIYIYKHIFIVGLTLCDLFLCEQEIGTAHMRVLDGMDTLLQLTGLVGKLVGIAGRMQANKR